jgi:uncharacterized protein DUF664
MAGQDAPAHYPDKNEFDGVVADPVMVQEAWRSEVSFSERSVDEAQDLGITGKNNTSLREMLVHVIEEYVRHNGHADFLRERIDGRVGQ